MTAQPGPGSHGGPGVSGPEGARGGKSGLSIAKWLRFQLLATIVLVAIVSPLGLTSAYSSLFGGMAAFLPAVFFAAYAGSKVSASSTVFLRAAVIGETLKLVLTVLICLAVFKWVDPLAPGAFFFGMIGVIMAGWVGLFRALS